MINQKRIAGFMATALIVTCMAGGADMEAKKKASLGTKSISLKVGKSKSISIKNKDKKATYKFTSSNKNVAKVTSKGKVTAVKAGEAKITVKEVIKKKKRTLVVR